MSEVYPFEASHCLNIDPSFSPLKQNHKRFASKRNQIISEEINKLLVVEAIDPCYYPQWISNAVVVNKKNGK